MLASGIPPPLSRLCRTMGAMTFDATRDAGLARLADFVPRAGRAYAAERNTDRGPQDRANVSTLSPWVRHRLVTEREVVEAVLRAALARRGGEVRAGGLLAHVLEGLARAAPERVGAVHRERGAGARRPERRRPRDLRRTPIAGRTGIEGFDDWARELVELGYLHNHARMWFASIWIFTLRLPWQLGADFFLRHLLDGDPASNTLSWRWVAGLQTVGKTYLATTQNIEFATEGRFRPTRARDERPGRERRRAAPDSRPGPAARAAAERSRRAAAARGRPARREPRSRC